MTTANRGAQWHGGLLLAAALAAQVEAADSHFPQQGVVALTPSELVQQVVASNASLLNQRAQQQIAAFGVEGEKGIFESEFFFNVRRDEVYHPNTASDRMSSLATTNRDSLRQDSSSVETGVVKRFGIGAEVKVSFDYQRLRNDVIPLTEGPEDTEHTSKVGVQLTVPLVRGFGSEVVGAGVHLAELEQEVARYQYHTQLLRTVGDAVSAYWQLYQSEQVRNIRQQSLNNARTLRDDIERRKNNRNSSGMALAEAESNLLEREIELKRAGRNVLDAQSQLKQLLDLPGDLHRQLLFSAEQAPQPVLELQQPFDHYLEGALQNWPGYRIAALRLQQENVRLAVAANEALIKLDLVAGFNTEGLAFNGREATDSAFSNDYNSWYVGVNFSTPLFGNDAAEARESQASQRAHQAVINQSTVRHNVATDLNTRLQQLQTAQDELLLQRRNVDLLNQLYQSQYTQFEFGRSSLSALLEREDDLINARFRLLDSEVRTQLANAALRLVDGSLLNSYDVTLAFEYE